MEFPPGRPHRADATGFEAWTFRSEDVFCPDALHELARRLPRQVYRAKGILRTKARRPGADRRGILQIVGRRADLVDGGPWPENHPPSALVFIGAAARMRSGALKALAAACLSHHQPEPGARPCGD